MDASRTDCLHGNNLLVSDLCFAGEYRKIDENEASINSSDPSYLPVSYLSQKLSQYSNCLVECSAVLSYILELAGHKGSDDEDVLLTLYRTESFRVDALLLCFEVIVLGNEYAQVVRAKSSYSFCALIYDFVGSRHSYDTKPAQ